MRRPTVAVIITCCNYGKYLWDCIDSVRQQSYPVEEIIVVDDASTDQYTLEVLDELDKSVVLVRNSHRRGLAYSANQGMFRAQSDYLMRLDADDWLHPSCVAVLVSHVDLSEHAVAAYSDYWEVPPKEGEEFIHRQQLDVPYGSCMLIASGVFHDLEGYNESLKYQEDYEFYKRLEDRYLVDRVELPLWYYRQHEGQMSRAHNDKMRVRQGLSKGLKVLTVIPARGGSKGVPGKNLRKLAGVPLVARAIRMVKESRIDTLIVVSTDDPDIAAVAALEGVDVIARPAELAGDEVSTIPVAKHAMEYMDERDWRADIVISVQPTCPYTPPEALARGLDKLIWNDRLESVVSIGPAPKHPFRTYKKRRDDVLIPYFPMESEQFLQRQDRPAAWEFTGGFYIRRRYLLEKFQGHSFALGTVAGVEVPDWAAVDIDTKMDLWLAETIVQHWNEVNE